ncbi:uncharacterized protein ACRADG_006196 [Cochliomyia hominivorax]
MAATKLVKNLLLIGFLLYAKTLYVRGSRGSSEEASEAPAGHIVYDQRQTGKYNIHVVIKDVAIIEMDQNEIADQNYNDDEYYYDEDDLTVKPLHIKTTTTTTTIKPLNSTTTEKTIITSTQTLLETTTDKPNVESTTILKSSLEISTNYHPPSNQTLKDKEQEVDLNKFTTSYVQAVDTKPRSKIEPIYAMEDEDTNLQSKHNVDEFDYSFSSPVQSRDNSYSMKNNMNNLKNSRIYKVKVHRSQQPPLRVSPSRRCRSYQYRDARGNCHGKRSSLGSGSILKRLFKMLITLPFRQDEEQPGVY